MQMTESRNAAEETIDEVGLADYDDEFDFYQALLKDEMFCAVAYLYQQADLYAHHEDARRSDRDARDVLRRSVREHAQRVSQEVDG